MPKEISLQNLNYENYGSLKNMLQNLILFQTVFKNESLNAESKSGCKLQELKAKQLIKKDTATYWPLNWRSKLCTCQDCMVKYLIVFSVSMFCVLVPQNKNTWGKNSIFVPEEERKIKRTPEQYIYEINV